MQIHLQRLRAFAFMAGCALLATGTAFADPASRVARLGYLTGSVDFSPAGENDWVQAAINRPLTTGDRLWADTDARTEIQLGGAMIRMDAGTGVSILNLDDRIAQLLLTQGTLNVRVRRLEQGQLFEVDTPNLAFTLSEPGEYRIEVDPERAATTIFVRRGRGEVYADDGAYFIDSRQPYRFTGTGVSEYQYVDAPRPDEFDRWSSDRDRRYDSSASARYVSQDVVGYQDLDANGSWRADPNYGNVWIPTHVANDWAPYRDGHWTWVDPWGWTWVDEAPWGFAVSHYGRWANLGGTWGWVPGPANKRAYYAPALVAFVGGANFQITLSGGNVGGVAWFPLAPREVYQPSYPVSRGYFDNVNYSNTVVTNTVVNNYYNDYHNNTNVTQVVYANRQVPGAVVAVPTAAFVQSQPVARAAVRMTREMISNAPVAAVANVAPTERSVHGASASGGKPPVRAFERPVVARTAPPAPHVGFAAQQAQLAAQPGKPLDTAVRNQLKPAAAAPAPMVKVIAPNRTAAPTAPPPRAAAAVKPEERATPAQPAKAEERARPVASAPQVPAQATAPVPQSRIAPATPAPTPPQQRGKIEEGAPPAVPANAPRARPAPKVEPPAEGAKPAAARPAAAKPTDKSKDDEAKKKEDEDERKKTR